MEGSLYGSGSASLSVEIALGPKRPAIDRPAYVAVPHKMGLEKRSCAFQPVSTGVVL